jgi:hypothetical protein
VAARGARSAGRAGTARWTIAAGDTHGADHFVAVADPVGAGFVESMARPGGNATGFIQFEYSLSGKWLELLRRRANNCLGSLLELRSLSLLGEERWLSYLNAGAVGMRGSSFVPMSSEMRCRRSGSRCPVSANGDAEIGRFLACHRDKCALQTINNSAPKQGGARPGFRCERTFSKWHSLWRCPMLLNPRHLARA